MTQYKITSADFISPGEALVPDTVLSDEDKKSIHATQNKMSDYLRQQIELRKAQLIEVVDIVVEQKKDV